MLAVLLAAFAAAAAPAALDVDDARVRALIPGQDKTVAYFELENGSTEEIVLIGAECDAARAVELHTVIRDGDMMRMRRLERAVVPAGGRLSFAPGGNHLMLFGVQALPEETEIRLITESGQRVAVAFRRIAVGAVQ